MSIHLHYVVVVVQSLNCVWLCDPIDASLSFTISWNLSRFMCMESVWLSNHVILCSPFLLLQSLPASGSFPMSQLFALGGQGIGASASISVLPKNIQGWFPLGVTGLICLKYKGFSRVFSNTTIQQPVLRHSALFIVQLLHPYMTTGKTIALTMWTFIEKVMSLHFNMFFMFVIAFLPRSENINFFYI